MSTPISGPLSLDRALSGQYSEFAPKDAVYELARSGNAGAEERLVALAREDRSLAIRRRAALALSLLPNARNALLQLLDVRESSVLTAVLLALARVGHAEDVNLMRRYAGSLSGHEAEQARFAELLLAHRVGLGPDVVAPMVVEPERKAPGDARKISAGNPQETEKAWSRFVPRADLGFEPDKLRSALIHCANRDILVVPSTGFGGEGSRVVGARMIAGATASYEREAGMWRHDMWILSAATSTGIDLQAWTLGGRASYTGQARIDDEAVAFEVVTAASSPLAIARVTGQLTRTSLTIEGVVGDRPASDARHAVPLHRPAGVGRRR